MTQRIFDIENEKDMADLWDILPDEIERIRKAEKSFNLDIMYVKGGVFSTVLKINWHDKTEITRPIQEATEADIGKLCYFWDDEFKGYGILTHKDIAGGKPYYLADDNTTYDHCRRLTKNEIEELC